MTMIYPTYYSGSNPDYCMMVIKMIADSEITEFEKCCMIERYINDELTDKNIAKLLKHLEREDC